MKGQRVLLISVIVLSFAFLAFRAVKEGLVYQKTVSEQINGGLSDQGVLVYENKISKYKVSLPNNWGYSEAESDNVFESRMEAIPPAGELKVQKINIDVVKPGIETAALYSKDEFKKWDEVASDTDIKGTTKLGEEEVGGHKILILADLTKEGDSPTDNQWSILGWFRDDERNFYVRMFGKQNFEEADDQIFRYLLRTLEVE